MNQLTSHSTCSPVFDCDSEKTFEKGFAANSAFFKGRLCFLCKVPPLQSIFCFEGDNHATQIALSVATEDIALSPAVKELIEESLKEYCRHSASEDRDKCYKRIDQFSKRVRCFLSHAYLYAVFLFVGPGPDSDGLLYVVQVLQTRHGYFSCLHLNCCPWRIWRAMGLK